MDSFNWVGEVMFGGCLCQNLDVEENRCYDLPDMFKAWEQIKIIEKMREEENY